MGAAPTMPHFNRASMPEFSAAIRARLSRRERAAVAALIEQVRRVVPADLLLATLFGSKARRTARPDSDVDVLLVFRRLPPDREPHASVAEALAGEIADRTGVPVTVWSVSLVDLRPGNRTPMLVDALDDGFPLFPPRARSVPLTFSPADALRCTHALLERVREGGEEVADLRRRGSRDAALRRIRDDLVRLCTASLLLRGVTRPRRGDAARACLDLLGVRTPDAPLLRPVLDWAARSYGPSGKDESRSVPPPPGGPVAARAAVTALRQRVVAAAHRLERGGTRSAHG